MTWLSALSKDPRPALLEDGHFARTYFARRDLYGDIDDKIENLWELPDVQRISKKQQQDGSWKYPGKEIDPETGQNYSLLETYRNLRVLVNMYGLTHQHPTLQRSADYLFGLQTKEGDIRGILGNQYMPYYFGEILACLIEAGYGEDERVITGLNWLLSMRQEDGGWIVPAQAVPSRKRGAAFWTGDPIQPDRSLPHAHLATGMVLRAFAAHPAYRRKPEVLLAGEQLKSRFFQSDKYNDRKGKSYWLKFQYPFWWSNLLTALDSLAKISFQAKDAAIKKGLSWFILNQEIDGLWPTGYGAGRKAEENRRWVGLAICRMMKMYDPSKPSQVSALDT
jgi:hypothetical protein